ncbi:hypothetical protein B0H19DRAFT_1003421 [Mycena capillaripes]|nr:hypothetical protein B0H19DRAFT_1003421 [Mycena capillaripes]
MSTNGTIGNFALRHIPALFIATTTTFGGLIPFFSAERAMLEFGLPPRIASSPPAQAVMITSSTRITAIGLLLFTFYFQNKLEAVDTVLVTLGYIGLSDAYVCWREGVPKRGLVRVASGMAFAVWGWLGMTAGNQ